MGFNDFKALLKGEKKLFLLVTNTLADNGKQHGITTRTTDNIKMQTLLKRVAESTVIFFPIFQLGCFKASATLASFSLSTGQSLLSVVKEKICSVQIS